MFRPLAITAAALTALVLAAAPAAAVPLAPAQAGGGSTPSAGNTCANPVLAQSATGWSATGGTAYRYVATGHVVARYALWVSPRSGTAGITLPPQPVTAGQQRTFAFDTQLTGSVRASVEWYNAANVRISRVDGTPVAGTASSWVRVSVSGTAPTGATRAIVRGTAAFPYANWWKSTACDYSPTVPPGGPGDGTQAATLLGWGPRVDGDEFTGPGVDTTTWALYDSPGHAGNGLRRPAQITVTNGVLTISGNSVGTTGGMSMTQGRKYGRWEARMQVPRGDTRYHPVLILWPDAEDWPTGGEVDYAETTAAATDIDFFLHYGPQNRTTHAAKAVDITQWHNYAVEWTPTHIRGYVDGVLFFSDTDTSHLPPRAMHQTIQLDWFPNGSTPTTPSQMNLAWIRIYNA